MEDEKKQRDEIGITEAWAANIKKTFDEYQQESLTTIRNNRTLFEKIMADATQFDNARQVIANQALQNAVETANMVAKKTIDHGELATDRMWNIDEVSTLSAKSGVQADLIQAIATAVTAEVLKRVQDGSIKA